MVRIEVTAEVIPASAPNRPSKQVAYAYLTAKDGTPRPHPERIVVPIWSDSKPYAPGQYTLAPASVTADKYRELALSPKLVALPAGR